MANLKKLLTARNIAMPVIQEETDTHATLQQQGMEVDTLKARRARNNSGAHAHNTRATTLFFALFACMMFVAMPQTLSPFGSSAHHPQPPKMMSEGHVLGGHSRFNADMPPPLEHTGFRSRVLLSKQETQDIQLADKQDWLHPFQCLSGGEGGATDCSNSKLSSFDRLQMKYFHEVLLISQQLRLVERVQEFNSSMRAWLYDSPTAV
jgi:hypothetical protein